MFLAVFCHSRNYECRKFRPRLQLFSAISSFTESHSNSVDLIFRKSNWKWRSKPHHLKWEREKTDWQILFIFILEAVTSLIIMNNPVHVQNIEPQLPAILYHFLGDGAPKPLISRHHWKIKLLQISNIHNSR